MDWNTNCDELKKTFDSQGYIAIPEFLNTAEVEELRGEIRRYIDEVVPGAPPKDVNFEVPGKKETIKQLIRMHQHDDYFKNLVFSDRFIKLAELLLGTKTIVKNLQWFNKPAGGSQPTPPHQDGYYFMLQPNEALTMWLALDEVNEENGCVRYVPGSHLRGVVPHERTQTLGFSQALPNYTAEDKAAEVPVSAHPGDLLVHHSLMIHRADANTTTRQRRAMGLIYYSADAKEDTETLQQYTKTLETSTAR